MAFSISYVVQAIDNFSKVAKEIAKNIDHIHERAESLAKGLKDTSAKFKEFGEEVSLYISAPIGAFGALALHAAAQQEKVQLQIANIIQNTSKAKEIMDQLDRLKMRAPFDAKEMEDSALRLLVMGTSADKVVGIMKNFSEVASGSGLQLGELVESFAVAQSSPEGMSRALMTLGRKIPIIKEMQKVFKEKFNMNVTSKQIRELAAQGRIDVSVLQYALQKMTEKGGEFYNSMDKQSHTLTGSISVLGNSFEYFLEAVGNAIMGSTAFADTILKVAHGIQSAAEFIEEFAKEHDKITKYIVTFGGIIAVLGPGIYIFGTLIKMMGVIAEITALMTTRTGLAVNGFLKFIIVGYELYDNVEIVRNAVDTLIGSFVEFYQKFPRISQSILFVVGALYMLSKVSMFASSAAIIYRGIMATLPPILAVARGAMLLLDAAFAANPFGVIAITVAALGIGILYLTGKFKILTDFVDYLKQKVVDLAAAIKELFSFDLGAKYDSIKASIGDKFSNMKASVTHLFETSNNLPNLAANTNILPANNNLIANLSPNLAANSMAVESKSSVDINLKGNTSVIQSVKSKTDGNTNLAVSQNMLYGGY